MKKLVLVPQNMKSRSAKALASKLSEKVYHKVWRVKPNRVRSRISFVMRSGTDKLTQLKTFNQNEIPTVDYCTDRDTALGWLRDGIPVVCRTLLRSSEGRGIHIAESEDQLVAAPLYTKYFKKKQEFRVHVFDGEAIDVQEKRKRGGYEGERNTRIRNTANGYVFCRTDVVEPEGLRDIAVRATKALGYRIGAVDIAFNQHHNRTVVLEVNACPGMEGTTLENYANKITQWYKEQI